jgi:glycosidase
MTQGRDPARTPMQWDPTENAGFTAADVEPWLPLDPEYRRRNVEALKADPDSLLQLIRQLLALRKAEPALRQGTYQAIETAESAVYGYCRRLAGRDLLVFLNFADHQSSIEEKMALYGTVLLSTHSSRIRHSSALSGLLEPYEGVVIASEA